MGKRGPKPKRKVNPDKEVTLASQKAIIAAGTAEVEAQLEILRLRREELERNPGAFDPQLATAANSLARAVSVLSSESRQLDKHRETAVIDLDHDREDELVRSFLTDISPQRREAFRKFLQDTAEETRLLSH